MVKYFCDKCGREIPEDNQFAVKGNKMGLLCWDIDKDVSDKQKKFFFSETLCEDCFDKVIAMIGGDESE